jgi:hypothetical protein
LELHQFCIEVQTKFETLLLADFTADREFHPALKT